METPDAFLHVSVTGWIITITANYYLIVVELIDLDLNWLNYYNYYQSIDLNFNWLNYYQFIDLNLNVFPSDYWLLALLADYDLLRYHWFDFWRK